MDIKINGITISLDLYGTRTEIIYENRNNKSLDLQNMTTKMICELFYCVVCANIEKKKLNPITFDEFLIAVEDENEGDKTIMDFWIWYVKTRMALNEVIYADIDKIENDTKKKKAQQ